MLTEEYNSRYAKAQAKFMDVAYWDAVKLAYTFEEECWCHNIQLLWMFAIEDYDPTPGAINTVTEQQINCLLCRMGADGLPDSVVTPPIVIPPVPIPTFVVDWAWMAADPYAALLISDNIIYNGNGVIAVGAPIYTDLRPSPANYFVVVRYPLTESTKTEWFNDLFNYGLLPDYNFRDILIAHGYKYVVSRYALTLNNAELTKFF